MGYCNSRSCRTFSYALNSNTAYYGMVKVNSLAVGLFLQNPVKSISLIGAEIEALEQDGRFDWTIRPQRSKRTFFLRAGSAEEQQQWMVAICEAQMSSGEHASNACVVQ